MQSEHKRVKHGQLPGDVPRRAKIRMREKARGGFWVCDWHFMGEKAAKSFHQDLREKGRTVQRRRDQVAIAAGLAE